MCDIEGSLERSGTVKKRRVILLIICICFILIHSAVSESISAVESRWFTEHVLNPLMSNFGLVANKDIVRKVAHVFEFFVLTLIVSMWWKKSICSFYTGFSLAFLDESLQLITGRGSLVADIWIDLIGVGIGVVIGWIVRTIADTITKLTQ